GRRPSSDHRAWRHLISVPSFSSWATLRCLPWHFSWMDDRNAQRAIDGVSGAFKSQPSPSTSVRRPCRPPRSRSMIWRMRLRGGTRRSTWESRVCGRSRLAKARAGEGELLARQSGCSRDGGHRLRRNPPSSTLLTTAAILSSLWMVCVRLARVCRVHERSRETECGMTDEQTITRIAESGLNAMVDETRPGHRKGLSVSLGRGQLTPAGCLRRPGHLNCTTGG